MLKVDVTPGEYGLKEFYEGYVWTSEDYTPDCKDIVKIFNTRVGDRGLSGTYWCGGTEDTNQMRLFNNWLRYHLSEEYLEHRHLSFMSDDYGEVSDATSYISDNNASKYETSSNKCDESSDHMMYDEKFCR